jgi:putative phosphoesterase
MKYGIFSDIHSNLEAFQVVLSFFKRENVDKFIFLGDVVGYGASPNETILLLQELKPVCIGGNHDFGAVDKFDISYFNPIAREAILWTRKSLKAEGRSFLQTLPLIYEDQQFICTHGSLYQPQQFHYILGMEDARFNFTLLDKQVCFFGHSHRQECYILKDNQVYLATDPVLTLQADAKYMINVGSVGQPRDRDWRTCLCIYDTKKGLISFRRLEYDVKKAANKILEAGLPSPLAYRLYVGY